VGRARDSRGAFLFAGVAKLTMPIEAMTQQIALSGWLLRSIAVCEILGATGLILPRALYILPMLTPLAAAGLAVIMAGAVVLSLSLSMAQAIVPFVVGLLCLAVVHGRRSVVAAA
jgi:DoxX-like family